jgi:hypothetical protein
MAGQDGGTSGRDGSSRATGNDNEESQDLNWEFHSQ